MHPFTSCALVALYCLVFSASSYGLPSNLEARRSRLPRQAGKLTVNAKPTVATDGSSVIMDMTATVQGTPLRFKVSAPQELLKVAANGAGAQKAKAKSPRATNGTLPGINVLLHGDGGQSFIDFPNQALQENLMGVAILAPNKNRFWGGGQGLQRTDGALHSSLINSLIQTTLPTVMNFDAKNVQFTGVSGGSLLLSGFFVPAFAENYAPTNVLLNCGGLPPQVQPSANFDPSQLKIHFQSTGNDLAELQQSIPQSIAAYTKLATQSGLTGAQLDAALTGDAKLSNGGHCEFDGKDFVSGVQLMSDSFSAVMQGGNGQVNGFNVLKSVAKNPNIYA